MIHLQTQWDKAQEMAAHLWWEVYKSRFPTEMRPFARAAMMLTAQASTASATEQGVVGWSKVGCIETVKRNCLATAKTDKQVNVNGMEWAMKQAKNPNKPPPNLALFDALDELVDKAQKEAKEAGLQEGEDDELPEEPAQDEEAPTNEDAPPPETEDASRETEDYQAWEVSSAEESGDEGYETDGAPCPALPKRSAIKCNATLQAALPQVVNLRGTDFESVRKLAFS